LTGWRTSCAQSLCLAALAVPLIYILSIQYDLYGSG
jgi:hypothetical protein